MIRQLRSYRVLGAGLLLLALVIGGLALALLLTAQGGSAGISLQGVSAGDLADFRIALKEPPAVWAPAVGADAAAQTAVSNTPWPGAKVRETVLVRLVEPSSEPPRDTLAWAVNFDPQTVPYDGGGGGYLPGVTPPVTPAPQTLFAVAFVDATSGKWLTAVAHYR